MKERSAPNDIEGHRDAHHALRIADAMAQVGATERGLTGAEATARLAQVGPNRLPEQPPTTSGQIFARQFRNPLIYVLGVAAVLALALGDIKDALFILAVLVINAMLGSYHELRAEKSSRAL